MILPSDRATSGFDIAVQHAICAEHLLSKLYRYPIASKNFDIC
jgi:hypothetical protein